MLKELNIKCSHNLNLIKVIKYVEQYSPEKINFTNVNKRIDFETVKQLVTNINDTKLRLVIQTDGKNLHQDIVKFLNKYYIKTVLMDYDLLRMGCTDINNPNFFELSNLSELRIKTRYDGLPFQLLFELTSILKSLYLFNLNDTVFYPEIGCATNLKFNILSQIYGHYQEEVIKAFKEDLNKYQASAPMNHTNVLRHFINELVQTLSIDNGCRCNHSNFKTINTNGKEVLCAYSDSSTDLITYKLERECNKCSYLNVCRNRCVADKTKTHCNVFKNIFNGLSTECDKRKITIADLIKFYTFIPSQVEL